jgi:hypothetical protein
MESQIHCVLDRAMLRAATRRHWWSYARHPWLAVSCASVMFFVIAIFFRDVEEHREARGALVVALLGLSIITFLEDYGRATAAGLRTLKFCENTATYCFTQAGLSIKTPLMEGVIPWNHFEALLPKTW